MIKSVNRNYISILLLGCLLTLMAGCTRKEKTLTGVVIGAGTGVAIGAATGGAGGAVAGGLVGGGLGGIIGNSMGDDD